MRYCAILIAVVLCGCPDGSGVRGKIVVTPDTRPAFTIDPSKPFVIELGRGSGMRGLDTVRLTESPVVEVTRVSSGGHNESTSVTLSSAQTKELVELVNARGLTGMGRDYSRPDISDGTQWVLWIEQAPFAKAIYFNNAFPDPITAYADRLDAVLSTAGIGNASWGASPQGKDRQAALWDRIRPTR